MIRKTMDLVEAARSIVARRRELSLCDVHSDDDAAHRSRHIATILPAKCRYHARVSAQCSRVRSVLSCRIRRQPKFADLLRQPGQPPRIVLNRGLSMRNIGHGCDPGRDRRLTDIEGPANTPRRALPILCRSIFQSLQAAPPRTPTRSYAPAA
jgi:hypothetical protein